MFFEHFSFAEIIHPPLQVCLRLDAIKGHSEIGILTLLGEFGEGLMISDSLSRNSLVMQTNCCSSGSGGGSGDIGCGGHVMLHIIILLFHRNNKKQVFCCQSPNMHIY